MVIRRAVMFTLITCAAACSLVMDPASISRERGAESPTEGGGGDAIAPLVDGSSSGCGTTFKEPAISSLQDDFTKGLGSTWNTFASVCVAASSGELVAKPPTETASAYCLAATAAFYHLTCDTVTVKVAESTSDVLGVQTFIYINTPNGNFELLKESAGFILTMPGDPRPSHELGPYDPARDVWWRFGESNGNISFATSTDGVQWNTRISVPTPVSLDRVQIVLGAGVYKAVAAPGQARFRCFNLPASCT